ncbi:MAG: mechanosensitive ion channel family protein [Acidimicrobiia bacterium]|nr:MAG: mechanosensitive ion channel family protein [Acidimicrobiia bacterium]
MLDTIVEWAETLRETVGGQAFGTIAVLIGAVVILWAVNRSIQRWSSKVEKQYADSEDHFDRERGQRLVTLTSVMQMLLKLVVWAIVILTVMGIWGIPMSPFIAVAATIGIAVGFGAQDLVKDVIAGFFILVEDQFGIGDVVTIAGVSGTVEAIKLRTTVLRDLNGNAHHVPNGQIAVASNLTPDYARVVADIGVSYDTDVDRAIEVIADEMSQLANDPDWAPDFLEQPKMLGVNELDDSAVVIRVLATVITEQRWAIKREFLRRIKNRLDAEGIEIPYNYMNVVIQSDEG